MDWVATRAPAAGYITDTTYTWNFYGDFAPVVLNHAAMLHGVAPVALDRGFSFLELGCGNGVSSAILAACYPQGEFHAVDLNAEHIDNVRGLASEGGLANLQFHHASFAQFLERASPTFDFIALHGVYSWVSPEVRAEIGRIADERLRPGGLLYVSYNAMPGWAALLPLRRMMLDYTAGRGLGSLEQASEGVRYLSYLREHGARCFADNPAAARMLDLLLGQDPRYVAHEYLNEHWNAFYFAEVAREFDGSGLEFVASLPLVMNYRDLCVREPKLRELVATAPDRGVYETHKSFVLNEQFRRDLYVKRPRRALEDPADAAWDEVVFGPARIGEAFGGELQVPAGTMRCEGGPYAAIAMILGDRSLPFAALRAHEELGGFDAAALRAAVHLLCAGGVLAPWLHACGPVGPREDGPLGLAPPLNRALLRRRLGEDKQIGLAAPAAGSGFSLDAVSALSLLARDQAPPGSEALDWALGYIERHAQRVQVGGRAVAPDEARAVLGARFEAFEPMVDRLRALGILTARPDRG